MTGAALFTSKSKAEYVCLECELPECNEKNPKCMYRLLKPKKGSQSKSKGNVCPHPSCNRIITDNAHTCVHHTWYR